MQVFLSSPSICRLTCNYVQLVMTLSAMDRQVSDVHNDLGFAGDMEE